MSGYLDLKALGITTADLLSYTEFRDLHLKAKEVGVDMFRNQVIINNTGMSRQVRRQREREGEKANLSPQLTNRLAQLLPGQGIFMQYYPGLGRTLYVGWPTERRKPRVDHSKRYASLFPVLPDAPDNQGRDGPGIPAS